MDTEYVVGSLQRIVDELSDVEGRLRRGDSENLTYRNVVNARVMARKLLAELEPQASDSPDRARRAASVSTPGPERLSSATWWQSQS
jgi:hypothetical protein